MKPTRKMKALIVDDVVDLAETLARNLDAAGFATDTANSGEAALDKFATNPPDVVVTDVRMTNMDGLELLSGLRQCDPTVPVVVMTAFGDVSGAVEAMRLGAFHYLSKPFSLKAMRSLVERACRQRFMAREAPRARTPAEAAPLSPLLGHGEAREALRARVEELAASASSILISGDPGSGNKWIARAIHAQSARAKAPFLAVNCATLPQYLLEVDLFGEVLRDSTGGASGRPGMFVEADGGTLFLDAVCELPPRLQDKLVRALQSGEVRPVGSETRRSVDVRCIAATHKDLGDLVAKGQFREDLFLWLDQVHVHVPPLGES